MILTKNHRQGDDRQFAMLLNRIREGKQTKDDLESLKTQVRPAGHPDIIADNTKICSTREEASIFNDKRLNDIPGKLYRIQARHFCKTSKNYKPIIKKGGKIADTQFEDTLKFKVGGRMMLIFNTAVNDGLCNGAMGTVLAVEESKDGEVSKIIMKFDNQETGSEKRMAFPAYTKKYPGGTVITKMEHEYSLGKVQSNGASAKLIQFPLISSFAVTAWKFQGQTVKKPSKYIVDLRGVRKAAQAYVMLSRGECKDQLLILEELPEHKIYPDKDALEELERMRKISINNNPTPWETVSKPNVVKVSYLNTRSIKNKFNCIDE